MDIGYVDMNNNELRVHTVYTRWILAKNVSEALSSHTHHENVTIFNESKWTPLERENKTIKFATGLRCYEDANFSVPHDSVYIADYLYCIWEYTSRANWDRALKPVAIKYTPMEPLLGYEDKYLPNLLGTKFLSEITGK